MELSGLISELFERDILITAEQAKKLTQRDVNAIEQLLADPKKVEDYLLTIGKEEPKPEIRHQAPDNYSVEVISNYTKKGHKRTYQDFVQHYNVRFQAMERYLRQRSDLSSTISIDKLKQHGEKKVAIIGFVSEKRETKNNHIIIELEDRSGSISVLCNKDKPFFSLAQDLCLDEIVGVVGSFNESIVFADELIIPSVPAHNELKKSPDEVYAVAISDIHFGNKNFFDQQFKVFLEWITGKAGSERSRAIAEKTKYIFIAGDIVEGVGVYPSQENDLSVPDIYDQYLLADETLSLIPEDKHVFIIPGNHDIGRLSEPQPPMPKVLFPKMSQRANTYFLSNPSTVKIHQSAKFPGFTVLLYHGGSFFYYGNNITRLFQEGGMSNPCGIMQYLLLRRHVSPTHTATLYVPDREEDPLIIKEIPDFFITGHLHTTQARTWNGITMLSCSCWVPLTEYQLKAGLLIDPGKFMLVNLQTRAVQALKPEDTHDS